MIAFNSIATGSWASASPENSGGTFRASAGIQFRLFIIELFSCDCVVDEDLQRRHLADGVQLGAVPGFLLIHVCLPYRELLFGLLLGLGWISVHDTLVRHCAVNASHGIALLAQLEPRHETVHYHVLDGTVRVSSRGCVQEEVQPSLYVFCLRPTELQAQ